MKIIYSFQNPAEINMSATAKTLEPGEEFSVPLKRWGGARATAYFLNLTTERRYSTRVDRELGTVTITRKE